MTLDKGEIEPGIKMIDVPKGAIICSDLNFDSIKRVVKEEEGEQIPSTMETDKWGARWYGTAIRKEWVPVQIEGGKRSFFDINKKNIEVPEESPANSNQVEKRRPKAEKTPSKSKVKEPESFRPPTEEEWIREKMRTSKMTRPGAQAARMELERYLERKKERGELK